MQVYEGTPQTEAARLVLTPNALVEDSPFTKPAESGSGFTAAREAEDAFRAAFQRENLLISGGQALWDAASNGTDPQRFDPNWNVYTHLKATYDKDTLDSLKLEIDQGLFEGVVSPAAADRKLANIVREKQLMAAEEKNWLGSLAGSLYDPTNFLPAGGWLDKGGKAVRMGKNLMFSAATIGLQEAGLWAAQDVRSYKESLLNVGAGTVLAGGLGAFAVGLSRSHPLHPEHVNNPLKTENLDANGIASRIPGEDFAPSTSGAAQVLDDNRWDIVPERVGGQRNAITKFIMENGVLGTPVARALAYEGEGARQVLTRLLDLGGSLTKDVQVHSGEDIKNNLLATTLNSALIEGDRLQIATKKALGDLGARKLDPADFNQTARKVLVDALDDAHIQELDQKYGPQGTQAILNGAKQYAEVIHAKNQIIENELVRIGAVRDTARVEGLKTKIDTAKESLTKELDGVDQQIASIEAKLKEQPEATVAKGLKDQIAALKASKEDIRSKHDVSGLRKELDYQMGLPEPMGRNYGHAQLWDGQSILANQAEFEEFIAKVLADHPDERWLLEQHNLTPGEFKKLAEDTPEKHREVLNAWIGDEWYWKVSRLEKALEGAEARLEQATLDFNDTLRSFGLSRHGEAQAKLTEAKRYRDLMAAEITTARQKRDALLAEQKALFAAAEAARTTTLERGLQLNVAGKPVPEPNTPALATISERSRQITRQLQKEEHRLARLEAGRQRFEDRWAEAYRMHEKARETRDAFKQGFAEAQKAKGVSAKNVKDLKKALLKESKRTPLDQYALDLKEALMNRNELPIAALDWVTPESGRMKGRRLILTREQRIEAERLGFLRTDLPAILQLQYGQTSGHIGVRQALDIGRGKRFESWEEVKLYALREYDDKIKATTDAKAKASLIAERDLLDKDITTVRNRLLGLEDPGADRDGIFLWGSRKFRQANYLRYGSGFLASSLTDAASVALAHRVIPMLYNHGLEALKMAFASAPKDRSALRAMVNGAELGLHGAMMSLRMSEEELANAAGIGARGTLTQRTTGAIDRGMNALTHAVSSFSGMHVWNRFWKIASGLQMSHDLRDMVGRYGSLSDLEKAKLNSLGIDSRKAERLNRFLTKYGVEENGHWDPSFDEWLKEPDGAQAVRDFQIAIDRDQRRAVMTPGVGDTPILMDKAAGKMWLQFQTFAFVFMNRYLEPLTQRAIHHKDYQTATSFASLMAMGTVVMALKDFLKGEDPTKRYEGLDDPKKATQFARELIDRTGLLGYLSPYVNSVLNGVGAGTTSRYQTQNWYEPMLGTSAGLVGDIGRFGSSVFQGEDSDKIIKKGLAIAPFGNLLRLSSHLYDNP